MAICEQCESEVPVRVSSSYSNRHLCLKCYGQEVKSPPPKPEPVVTTKVPRVAVAKKSRWKVWWYLKIRATGEEKEIQPDEVDRLIRHTVEVTFKKNRNTVITRHYLYDMAKIHGWIAVALFEGGDAWLSRKTDEPKPERKVIATTKRRGRW